MAGMSLDKDMSGGDNELFYLKWHNFQKNVSKQFERLREDDDLVDITFACDGKQIRAHKLVLFACSPYFKQLLKANPCKHPVFYMNDVKFEVLKSILEYMYLGEVHISNENLKEFIRVAEGLKIRGLTKGKESFMPYQTGPAAPPPLIPPLAPQQQQQHHHHHHIDQLDFDSDLSQQSSPVPPGGESPTKRMKLSECFEVINVAATSTPVSLTSSNVTTNTVTTNNDHQQQQQQVNHNHVNHQHQQHHPHHQPVQHHHQQQIILSHHPHHQAEHKKMQTLEPKVEMVEYLDTQSTTHSVPPPAYCQMQPLVVASTAQQDNKSSLSLAACPPDNPSVVIEEAKLQQQQHHPQQQTHHGGAAAATTALNCWMETKAEQQQQASTLDTSAITQASPSGGSSAGESKSSAAGAAGKSKKQANCLNPHPCPVCARLYSNVSNLRQHMRLIHNRTEVCCPLCQKNFNSALYLKRHYTSVHGYPNGSLTAGSTTTAASERRSGGGGGGEDKSGSGSTNNNNSSNGGGAGGGQGGASAAAANGGIGTQHSGWNLYEMENSSSGNICQ